MARKQGELCMCSLEGERSWLFLVERNVCTLKLGVVPLTDVASKMPRFACNLLIAVVCKQFLEYTRAVATCGILCNCNGIIATYHVQ